MKPPPARTHTRSAGRLTAPQRREQIVDAAIVLLCDHGQSFNTRELAAHLGISHALLFKHFPTKGDILDAVFQRVYLDRFTPAMRQAVQTRSPDPVAKWSAFYATYAPRIFDRTWIRIFISTALNHEPIAARYFELVVEPLVTRLAEDTERDALGRVQRPDSAVRAITLELAWTTHSALFYSGLRRWVYERVVPDDIVATMRVKVVSHFAGARVVLGRTPDLPDLRASPPTR